MGGQSTNTTTQNTTSQPWDAAQPALKTSLNAAQNLYDAGVGGQVYTGSTVVPYSNNTTYGMNNISNIARGNMNGAGTSGQYQSIINNGGYNDAQKTAVGNLQALATNPINIYSNPAYMQTRDKVAQDVTTGVNLGASSAGRYGSGQHVDTLANSLSNNLAGMDVAELQRQQGRQDAATQGLFQAGQQGIGNLSTAYSGMSAPAQDMLKLGSMDEDYMSRLKNDEMRVFDAQQSAPWQNLSRLNAIASGAGQLGGTSSGTAQTPGQSPFATGLGYAASGLGILGGLNKLGWF